MLQIAGWLRATIIAVVLVGVLFAMPNLFYDRVESHNDAVALADTQGVDASATGWPGFLPSGLVNLGLDLRGGAHLLAEVAVEDVYVRRMDALWPQVRDALVEVRDEVGFVRRLDIGEADVLDVEIGEASAMNRALEVVRGLSQPVSGAGGIGSTTLAVSGQGNRLSVELSDAEKAATDSRTIQQSLEIIRRRIDEVGTREPTIQRQGAERILIQVPGIGSAEELKELIGTTAQLTFHAVEGRVSDPQAQVGVDEILVPDMTQSGVYYRLAREAVVTGEDLVDAQPAFNQNGEPSVSFRFDASAARTFGTFTANNVGTPFAIVLDDEVVSAPVIREAIPSGTGQISGSFTVEESTQLAVLLRAGALPAELVFLEERTIGPELGQDSIEAGQLATLVAFVAVLGFMALCYGLFGLFANVALLVNVALLFALLSIIGATLTLPGIAGIVLTIGMAVDANVLVFERIREEMKSARGPARAIELGYERALSAILDANVTTFITATILFVMGSGPVRGFAVTLGLGIVTSVFTAIFVTRLLIVMWLERARPRTLEV